VLQVSPVSGAENVVPSTEIVEGETVPIVPAEYPVKDTVVVAPPVDVRVPLSVADVAAILVAEVVTTTDEHGLVVNVSVAPGVAEPAEFEAVALNEYEVLHARPVRVALNVVPLVVIEDGEMEPRVPVENPVRPGVVVAPPVFVTVPLSVAEFAVIVVAAVVITVGTQAPVVNERVAPGVALPAEFEAVALNEYKVLHARPVRVALNVPPVDVATNVEGETVPRVPVENPVKLTVVSPPPVEVRVPVKVSEVADKDV